MIVDPYKEIKKKAAMIGADPTIDQSIRGQYQDQMGPPAPSTSSMKAPESDATPEVNPIQWMPVLNGSKRRMASTESQDEGKVYGDVASGIAGALGMLSGGTSQEKYGRMAEKNKYLQSRANADKVTKKELTTISNEEGKPEYVRAEDALGMSPYYAPKIGANSNMLMKGQPSKFINKTTGDVISVAVGPDNVVRKLGHTEPFDLSSDWVPHEGFATPSGTDVFGTKTTDLVAKAAPNIKKNAKSTQGLGSYMGGIPQLEAESRMKEAGRGKEKVAESMSVVGELEATEKKLQVTNDPMTFSIGVGQALRAVEKRLSEDEQKRFMGDDYRGVIQNAGNYLTGKMGNIPESIRSGVIEAIRYLKEKELGKIKSNKKSYSDKAGLNKAGSEMIKRTSGQGVDTNEPPSDWRSGLKGLYR